MINFSGPWAGRIFGTNVGNMSAHFEHTADAITGTLRVLDDNYGIAVYEIKGIVNGSKITLNGFEKSDSERKLELVVEANLTAEGSLRGEWALSAGNGGSLILFPHSETLKENASEQLPEQIRTVNHRLGSIRLYADDLLNLMNVIQKDFRVGKLVVNYEIRGSETSVYAADFVRVINSSGECRRLSLRIQEPEAHGINRQIIVEFNAIGINAIQVQGIQETWVVGQAESIRMLIKQYESGWLTAIHQNGASFNALLAFIMIALIPDLSLLNRIIFIIVLVAISQFWTKSHQRFVPNAVIYLTSRRPTPLERKWPQLSSWIIATTSALVAAVAYGFLSGDLKLPL